MMSVFSALFTDLHRFYRTLNGYQSGPLNKKQRNESELEINYRMWTWPCCCSVWFLLRFIPLSALQCICLWLRCWSLLRFRETLAFVLNWTHAAFILDPFFCPAFFEQFLPQCFTKWFVHTYFFAQVTVIQKIKRNPSHFVMTAFFPLYAPCLLNQLRVRELNDAAVSSSWRAPFSWSIHPQSSTLCSVPSSTFWKQAPNPFWFTIVYRPQRRQTGDGQIVLLVHNAAVRHRPALQVQCTLNCFI